MVNNVFKEKRWILHLLVVCILLLIFDSNVIIATASEDKNINKTYTCDEIGMSLSLPEEWYVFTEDNLNDNPNYAFINSDKDTMKKHFANNSLAFDCLEPGGKTELSCIINHSFKSNKIVNMKNMSINDLNSQGKALIKYDYIEEEKNLIYSSYEILDNDLRFLVLNGTLLDHNDLTTELAEFIQYTTIVNGENITFQYYSYGDEISLNEKEVSKEIINSIKFDTTSNQIKYSTDLILKALGIILFLILAILSVLWHIRRYKRKLKQCKES